MTTLPIGPAQAHSAAVANIACVASMLVWAVGFPLADELLKILPSITIAALRLSLAALFLLPLWFAAGGWNEASGSDWLRALIVGAFSIGVGALLMIYAQMRTDGITIAVIFAAMPVVGITLECLYDGRRLSLRLLAGLILSVAGGVAVYGVQMGHLNMGLGAAAAFVAVIVFAWGSRASVKALPTISALGRTTMTLTGAALIAVLAEILFELSTGTSLPWQKIGSREWTYLLIYAVGGLAVAQLLFLVGVASLGVGIATMHINIAPFYVMIFSLAFGSEWNWALVGAAALVALGTMIAQGRSRHGA